MTEMQSCLIEATTSLPSGHSILGGLWEVRASQGSKMLAAAFDMPN